MGNRVIPQARAYLPLTPWLHFLELFWVCPTRSTGRQVRGCLENELAHAPALLDYPSRALKHQAAVLVGLDKCMSVQHTQFVMRRTTVWLSKSQIEKLAKLSKRTGLKVAELIRRFIDEGLKKESN